MILRNGISEKTIDLVNEDRILRMNEMRLRIFFDAIRKQNNKFVLNHLATEENKKKLNENNEKEAKNDKRQSSTVGLSATKPLPNPRRRLRR